MSHDSTQPLSGLLFETDANSAIHNSIERHKPLLMLITGQSDECESWIDGRLTNKNERFESSLRPYLSSEFVLLKIFKDTPDFFMLLQIYPQFGSIDVPAVLIVSGGKIVDLIGHDVSVSEFTERMCSQMQRGKKEEEEEEEKKKKNDGDESNERSDLTSERPLKAITKKTGKIPKSNNTTGYTTSAVQAAAAAAASAASSAALERERILRRVKLDREEIKHDRMEEKHQISEEPVRENIHNKDLETELNYVLQVRLLDGKAIRSKFQRDEKLGKVRDYILEQYPDYRNVSFYFYRNVDRVTYKEEDEAKSLRELNLNRATLLMRPLERQRHGDIDTPTSSTEIGNAVTGTVSWLKNRVGSYLWGTPPAVESSRNTIVHQSKALYHDEVTTDPSEQTSNFNPYGQSDLIDKSEHTEAKKKGHSTFTKKSEKRPQVSTHESHGTEST
ncbi:hypothetical protein FOA43_002734 [Brettanomyces nanus]|uniref:UBX domain-containing protein n=1 Tax=Eeniella nana TaxID=13502 RepID=A0A875RPS3_EENNA|nr:uncharacterized protein FOA43_002734 [Brettanomyces nanus]QPG75380.1 hypothetical protein FOA43_002734 [Brettanomyces nanus]